MITERTWTARTAVYRLYDATGRLLYVGVAINPEIRLAHHALNKVWWRDVDHSRTRIEWYPDRVLALTEEERAIRDETPVYNVTLSQVPTVPRDEREATPSDIRRLRIDSELWAWYTEIVGDGGRSADLRSYIEWRIDNPTTPLPGRRRGPVKRERKQPESEE